MRATTDGYNSVVKRGRQLRMLRRPPTNDELETLYAFDPMAARIVDRLPDDATRQPFAVAGDNVDTKAVSSWAEDTELLTIAAEASRSARLYGGAIVVADDGGLPDAPIDPTKPVLSLRVVDAPDAQPVLTSMTIAEYLHPPSYNVSLGIGQVNVHSSRVWRFNGVKVPVRLLAYRTISTNPGWGPSVLQRLIRDLDRLSQARKHAGDLLHVLSIPGLKITDLKKQLEADGGREQVSELLDAIRASMTSLGLLAIDKNDESFTINRESRGAVDLLGEHMNALVSDTDMPREVLTGQSPGGLNTGELAGPVRLWYDHVDAYRQGELTPFVVWALDRSGLVLPAEYTVEWAPLWQDEPGAVATRYKTTAEADKVYVDMGSLKSSEIRQSRFVDGEVGPIAITTTAIATTQQQSPAVGESTTQVSDVPTPAEQGLNGAQITGLLAILQAMNTGAISYEQAAGMVGASLPPYRGREAELLGPPRAPMIALGPAPAAGSTPTSQTAAAPSSAPPPGDAVTPREAAAAFGVPTRTITLAMQRGELSFWGLGRHKRVSLAEVAALAKRHEQETEDPDDETEEETEP